MDYLIYRKEKNEKRAKKIENARRERVIRIGLYF